tara:strand:+ start:5008 stop:5376 length:369 start_codon:yes stop_codon:yes gene_type:complete
MIDTDKYEGHIEGPWTFDESSFPPHVPPNIVTATCQEWRGLKGNEFHDGNIIIADFTDINDWRIIPTTRLIADAPLLLQEVKRLREGIVDMIDSMDNYYVRDIQHATDCLRDMIGYYEDEEE